MKIDRLETHDRLLEFKSDWEHISQAIQDCINNVPDEIKFPFYVYGHSRQIGMDERFSLFIQGKYKSMEEVPSERMIWMPRAYKPKAEPNTYLFRAIKGSDVIETMWILPKPELWEQFAPGKITHNEDIWTSIQNYKHRRKELEAPDSEDLTLHELNEFKRVIRDAAEQKLKSEHYKKMYGIIDPNESYSIV